MRWFAALPSLVHNATNFGLIGLCLDQALPAAIAVFPHKGSIKTEDLEPELRAKAKGSHATYSKGL
jgi:hypothetical protein